MARFFWANVTVEDLPRARHELVDPGQLVLRQSDHDELLGDEKTTGYGLSVLLPRRSTTLGVSL
jgi:hypothetical protein